MPIPSKNFTVIADASIDVDSPLTTGLFVKLRDNDIHLEEWLGLSFVAAQDHDHDGANSKRVESGLVFIERHETTVDETSFDFSATLDGDTEAVYYLTGRWKRTAGLPSLSLRANTATTVAIAVPNDSAFLTGTIFAKRTVQTVSMDPGYVGHSVADGGGLAVVRGDSFSLAANLTSLGLISSIASEIRKGSAFNLYRLAQV